MQLLSSTITICLFRMMPLQFVSTLKHTIFYVFDDLGPTCRRPYYRIDQNTPAVILSLHPLTLRPHMSSPTSVPSPLLCFFGGETLLPAMTGRLRARPRTVQNPSPSQPPEILPPRPPLPAPMAVAEAMLELKGCCRRGGPQRPQDGGRCKVRDKSAGNTN